MLTGGNREINGDGVALLAYSCRKYASKVKKIMKFRLFK